MGNTESGFPRHIDFVKLRECEDEHDCTIREATFAFRCPILNSTPYWTLVIQFPGRRSKTYLFQAREENGFLQAFQAKIHGDVEIFQRSTYFGSVIETSPKELLEKAKQVETGEFNVLANKKAWLKEFLDQISPELSIDLSREYLRAKREAIESKKRKERLLLNLLTVEIVLAASLVGVVVGRGGN